MPVSFSQIKGGKKLIADVDNLKDTTATVVKFVVGNGLDNVFILTHKLKTRDVVVSIRENVVPYEIAFTTVQATTEDAITVMFNNPPEPNEYTVTIIG